MVVVRGGGEGWWQGVCVLLLGCVCVDWAGRSVVVCGGTVWCCVLGLLWLWGVCLVPGLVVRVDWVLGFGLNVCSPP